jgi:NhaP-type Na+/H+ or K+/H+ antiporter
MIIGAICRVINKKTKFPYTPLLLIVGLLLGNLQDYLGVLGAGTNIIAQLNPHMILLIFIPILIFESGFNCDWYIFKKALLNILLLAGPGVLWGAILIGFTIKKILGY